LFKSEGESADPILPGSPFKMGAQILEAAVGDVVDFKITNPTMMYHPFHLRGYAFWVLGVGNATIPEEAPRPSVPVLKDNQNIPPMGGWAWLRVVTDSPGWWIFHCHIDFHWATGMDLVLKVGTSSEIKQWNQPPPSYLGCVEKMGSGGHHR